MLSNFTLISGWSIVLLILGTLLLFISTLKIEKRTSSQLEKLSYMLLCGGFILIVVYTATLWVSLGRPPMRTVGETRLWYSIFALLVSFFVFLKWRYKLLIFGGAFFAIMFMSINFFEPELLNKNLPPALQSIWFIPHVSVYMLAYSILGMSCLTALVALLSDKKEQEIIIVDNLVYIGFGFLTLGMTFGAFWAKEAWGNYWAWDPKETWAMITWLAYMLYIHYRLVNKKNINQALWILVAAFVILLFCWFGLNNLESAQGSIHSY